MSGKIHQPVVLVIYDSLDKWNSLMEYAGRLDNGRLTREFEFVYCDCLGSVKNWYKRHPGAYVSAVLIGVDFSDVDSDQKLAVFPFGIRPARVPVDVKLLQGFVIYHHLRFSRIEEVAPVILHLSGESLRSPEQYIEFIHTPSIGECHFGARGGYDEPAWLDIVNKIDQCALRPLTDQQRFIWRKEHNMVVGRSRRMAALAREIERVALSDSIVLIIGPPGSGKELVAQAIHRLSYRYSATVSERKNALTVQMTAMDKNLCLDELFGHVAGAFTDARTARAGIFETANGSTVFLDEIGEIDHELQKKLLRVIEYHRIKPLGSSRELETDVRIIAATNRTIEELQERFRSDFYTRLAQQCLIIPSVTERWSLEKEEAIESDIGELFEFFADLKNKSPYIRQRIHPDLAAISFLTQIVLQHLSGERLLFNTGNIRTLRTIILQAYDRAQHENSLSIGVGHVATAVAQFQAQFPNGLSRTTPMARGIKTGIETLIGSLRLEEMERVAIKEALIKCNGNHSRAAELLGIHRDTLRNKIKKLGLS